MSTGLRQDLERAPRLALARPLDLAPDRPFERRGAQPRQDVCAPAVVPERHGIVLADTEQGGVGRQSQAFVQSHRHRDVTSSPDRLVR